MASSVNKRLVKFKSTSMSCVYTKPDPGTEHIIQVLLTSQLLKSRNLGGLLEYDVTGFV